MNEFELKNLTCESTNEKVMDWDFLCDDSVDGRWRVYYKPYGCEQCGNYCDKKHGFKFVSVEWAGNYIGEPTWGENSNIWILYHGMAYFDGLRHLYCGSEKTDNFAYFYYPHAEYNIGIWQKLLELENKYCSD